MIEKIKTDIDGIFILSNKIFLDNRGSFKKILNADDFKTLGLNFVPKELYYSINKKNVIRGMHFQLPPHAHAKLVYVVQGTITDVCLDIRKNSKTCGKYFSITLCGTDDRYLYLPAGIAHGFVSREDNTIVHYAQTSCYSKAHDAGIQYNSFGFDWKITSPIVSERDKAFPDMKRYEGVFSI